MRGHVLVRAPFVAGRFRQPPAQWRKRTQWPDHRGQSGPDPQPAIGIGHVTILAQTGVHS